VKIAVLQMPIIMGKEEKNLHTINTMFDEAVLSRPDFVVIPECAFLGWLSDASAEYGEPIPGTMTHMLSRKAMGDAVYLAAGITERAGDLIYNSAVLIDRRGNILLTHRKINELDIGLKIYKKGNELGVADTKFGRVGLDICSDSWVPCITQTLALMGAKVIFSPCAWACEKGEEQKNLRSIKEHYANRTFESNIFLVGANAVGEVTEGPWKGKVLQGSSLIYGPGGELIAEGKPGEPNILQCEIKL